MPEATANALSQMEELVTQNYNHPSIICWGLSNEITVIAAIAIIFVGSLLGALFGHKMLKKHFERAGIV